MGRYRHDRIAFRAAELLRASLGSIAHIAAFDGGVPADPQRWGWPHGQQIGWLEEDLPADDIIPSVYLDSRAALAALNAQGHTEHNPLTPGQTRLVAAALHGTGLMQVRWLDWPDGTSVRAWQIPADWLHPDPAHPWPPIGGGRWG